MTKRTIDYRHILCAAITLGFLACTVFLFPNALGRLVEGFRDFGLSVAFYFCKLFGMEGAVTPTVNELPKIPFFDFGGGGGFFPSVPSAPPVSLPETWDGFQSGWVRYWQLWASADNFLAYLFFLANLLYYASYAFLIVIPLILLFRILFKRYLTNENNDYDKDSKPLKAFKKAAKYTYRPVKYWLSGIWSFLRLHGVYLKIWLVLWLFNFNVLTIGIEFIAFYLYFATSFDVAGIYRQVYKLFLDLSVPLSFIPLWCWLLLGLFLFLRFRRNIALTRLRLSERSNSAFTDSTGICTMICAPMGFGKTKMATDMSLSASASMYNEVFKHLLENDLKFPCFPWINLQNELKKEMDANRVYNLASCKRYIRRKADIFRKVHRSAKTYIHWREYCRRFGIGFDPQGLCFGYDYEAYGLFYDDKLKEVFLFDVLETYAQLFFIYICNTSLLVSNYAIRVDDILSDVGNFPLWNSDFFERDSRLLDSFSRHSHIIDYDALRLGRKLVEGNKNSHAFEFGIVVITEIGKERKNMPENMELKKNADETNQKNDLFDYWVKMIRHPATVDNYPFVKVIVDEQRPESWGANARDLCEVVHIRESSGYSLLLPFFGVEELLYRFVFSRFEKLYTAYRYARGDNTLFMYIVKGVVSRFNRYYNRIYNQYSRSKLYIQTERGTLDGKQENTVYYIMPKKIHAKRYDTACYSDFFDKKALAGGAGINDLKMYETEKASFAEMLAHNSYFMNDINNCEKKPPVDEKEEKKERDMRSALSLIERVYAAGDKAAGSVLDYIEEIDKRRRNTDKAFKSMDLLDMDKIDKMLRDKTGTQPGGGKL
jgi:hypothetical protein